MADGMKICDSKLGSWRRLPELSFYLEYMLLSKLFKILKLLYFALRIFPFYHFNSFLMVSIHFSWSYSYKLHS